MASPLEHFRKNQKTYMAALVVISLITFVLIPGTGSRDEINSLFSGNRNTSLVSWKGGSLGQAELERMRTSQLLTYRVFEKVYEEVNKAGGQPRIPSFQSNANGFSLGIQPPPDANQMSSSQIYQALANQHLLAQTAAKHGIIVDDKAVDTFIQKFTDGKVSGKRFAEIIKETAGSELNRFSMYSFLKGEIARQILVNLGDSGLTAPASSAPIVTPAMNWTNFQKFQQRAKIEAYPVFVDEFLEKVTEKPSEQELRAIYERGKNQFLPADSPEPGFFKGYKTNLEYVVADMDSFIKKEEAGITEELLKAEYDKRVNDQGAFRVPITDDKGNEVIPVAEPTGKDAMKESPTAEKKETSKPEETPEKTPSESKDKTTEEKAKAPKAKSAKSKSAEQNATDPKSAETKSTDVKAETPKTPTPELPTKPETGAPSTPATESPAPAVPAPEAKSSRLSPRSDSAVRLVAFQSDEKPSASDVPSESKAVTEAVAETKPASNNAKPTEATTADTKPADAPKAETEAKPTTTASPTTDKPAETGSTDIPKAVVALPNETKPAEPPMRTRTLDEVREELKRDMASGPARQKREEALKAVAEAMEKYFHEKEMFRTGDPNDKTLVEPEPLSLPKLADQYGLNYGKTGLVDAISVQSLSIGRSFLGDFRQSYPVTQFVFNKRVRSLFPMRSMGFDNSQLVEYVFWKTEEEAPRTPAFEEVRADVEKAWRTAQARRLASEKANELASSLNATNDADPWPSVLDESLRKLVIKPPMFTWLQPPFQRNDLPSLSNIEGIVQPGASFMERTFSGKLGQAVVAFDEPQQKCFVIRIIERNPSDEELQAKFQASPGTDDATRMLGQAQAQAMATGWLVETQNSIGVDASRLQGIE